MNKCKAKKKRRIKDCPPEKIDECEKASSIIAQTLELKDDGNKKKKKCPKFDKEKCAELPDEDDPCGLKRKGKTRECPSDLTKRHRKYTPRKKGASSQLPLQHVFVEKSSDEQQNMGPFE